MTVPIQEMIATLDQVVSFPAIVHRVNRALEDPFVSIERLSAIITEDPALCARLLKLVNSSFFRFPAPINTITHALTMIGTKQLRDLVSATAVMDMFHGIPADLVDMVSFWRHSVLCGIASRVLATARREANVERVYLIGLLHDIGRLVIYVHMAKLAREMLQRCREDAILLHEEELRLMGYDHAHIGGLLLKSWNLPADIHVPVSHHHHPSNRDQFALETAIVHVADLIAIGLECGSSGEWFIPPVDPQAWELLDLPASALAKILKQVEAQFQQANQIFAK